MIGSRPFAFLDKDGTVVRDVPYNVDPARMTLNPGAAAGLRALQRAGFGLAIVSNQSGVARGYFDEDAVRALGRRLIDKLREEGVDVEAFYYCPHLPGSSDPYYAVACDCRKPAPGLLFRAARELGADLSRSWLVGDILDDIEAGHRAGCRTVLLDVGHETEWRTAGDRRPDALAPDLPAAAEFIIAASGLEPPVAERAMRHGAQRATAAATASTTTAGLRAHASSPGEES